MASSGSARPRMYVIANALDENLEATEREIGLLLEQLSASAASQDVGFARTRFTQAHAEGASISVAGPRMFIRPFSHAARSGVTTAAAR
jgi:hypothetical protein